MNGTEWVAPNEGSTVGELYNAFTRSQDSAKHWHGRISNMFSTVAFFKLTNLHLTGTPITDYDWQRLESDAFKVGE